MPISFPVKINIWVSMFLLVINVVNGYPNLQDLLEQVFVHCNSSCVAVVTKSDALLWTDSRYFLQAGKQLPSFWTLMKSGTRDCPTMSVLSLSLIHFLELALRAFVRKESCGRGWYSLPSSCGNGIVLQVTVQINRISPDCRESCWFSLDRSSW